MTTIEDRIRHIIAEQLGLKIDEVQNDAQLTNELGADSLDAVELTMAFEEEFNCHISDEEAANLTTAQKAIEYIEALSANESSTTAQGPAPTVAG